ncbi:ABC transporter permease [Pseudofrankia inefficax]|uniref:Binding-protein-dependent transport systems inner membrane component n=1 Tax=Pseudofrankia inefficax (strain DSM 45817 / CECT 9037 / DDB 130130 / EuI1c) TaxID=298654 RepID=E3JCZ0_PSEI1|nr:ABC transporter permease [Pseudofrankia inefficax]ADP81129.1 binding-protein-dependent transport systems inner membrane component [Pseudofrankia inefficax]
MWRYVLRRLAQAVGVLWAAYTVTFLVLDYLPGDPVTAMAGAQVDSGGVDPALVAKLRHQYGFDQPVLVQYFHYLFRALRGDLGVSVSTGRPVTSVMGDALPPTLALTGLGLAIGIVTGASLALVATYTNRRWLRQGLLSLPSIGVSVPGFWVGLMLVQLFSFRIRLFPAFGNDGLRGLVLPAVTLAVLPAAMIAQILAKSLLTALAEPYAQTAQAKGAGRARVHLRHALRNALLPALTITGVLTGQLMANAVVVETVFSRNGLGRATAAAVNAQDIPVVQGVVVFGAFVFVTVNLLIDLVYPLLDPRITVGSARRGLSRRDAPTDPPAGGGELTACAARPAAGSAA